eukprot:CAMPEP_0201518650 /NCGR_PEP_ID=MMETSP0161_2-20130828/9437_1 /ASSEMBLY_ACC=CAM_ASM_000251 /TAXON_ID=180227 /ORGANISM="Neoparamoeba aestuarina, Strain SoJaBio B1-5/56/2" /LENGTH=262 /DNA_ID=CAMNT_0047916483 /DNA_START=6 /DNA_END=794 /DNA_ORIENTATION=+
MKINDSTQFQDFRSLCAIHGDYITSEPFIKWDYDCRIQKIGNNYRAFKRVSANWKGNVGNMSQVSDMEMTPQFQRWIDECAKCFGGLDICGLDFVHDEKTGKFWILELNDTAIGLVHKHEEEDHVNIRNLVLARMAQHFEKIDKEKIKKEKGDRDDKEEKKEKEEKQDEGEGKEQGIEKVEGEEKEKGKEEKEEGKKKEEKEMKSVEKEEKEKENETGGGELDQLRLENADLKRQLHEYKRKEKKEKEKPEKEKNFIEKIFS